MDGSCGLLAPAMRDGSDTASAVAVTVLRGRGLAAVTMTGGLLAIGGTLASTVSP